MMPIFDAKRASDNNHTQVEKEMDEVTANFQIINS